MTLTAVKRLVNKPQVLFLSRMNVQNPESVQPYMRSLLRQIPVPNLSRSTSTDVVAVIWGMRTCSIYFFLPVFCSLKRKWQNVFKEENVWPMNIGVISNSSLCCRNAKASPGPRHDQLLLPITWRSGTDHAPTGMVSHRRTRQKHVESIGVNRDQLPACLPTSDANWHCAGFMRWM